MIAHLRGTLLEKHPNQAIVEAGGVGYDVTYRLKVRDGSYRWFRATGGVVLDEQRQPRRACGSLVDIDAAVKAEEEKKAILQKVANTFQEQIGTLVQALSSGSTELEATARAMSGAAGPGPHAAASALSSAHPTCRESAEA